MSINYTNQNTIIFSLARMNPPTPGHLYLIKCLIEEGIKKNVDIVYVILSKTNDNNENPIPCNEKVDILGANKDVVDSMVHALKDKMISATIDENIKIKINNINVVCLCVPDIPRATPFTAIGQLISERANMNITGINLFLIIGDDRAEMLDSISDVFLKNPNVNSVDGLILDRPDMGTYKKLNPSQLDSLDIATVPIGAFSASFVRNLVKYGLKDKFFQVYSPYLDKPKIESLYNSILKGLLLPPNKKKESPQKPMKYTYPKINTTLGGKRKSRKSHKKSRKSKKVYKKTYKKRNYSKN